jgi:hypothetical protein
MDRARGGDEADLQCARDKEFVSLGPGRGKMKVTVIEKLVLFQSNLL